MFGIRERLRHLGKTQVWLILQLKERNLTVQTSEFSYILSGVISTPKAQKVLKACNEILSEYEKEVKYDGAD